MLRHYEIDFDALFLSKPKNIRHPVVNFICPGNLTTFQADKMAESGVAKDVTSVSFFSDISKVYMICITFSSVSEGN